MGDSDVDPGASVVPVVSAEPSWRARFGLRLLGEFALVAGLLIVYREVRTVTRGDIRDAFANARAVLDLQRWVGLTFEDELQRWVIGQPAIIRVLNNYYVWMHFPVAIALLVWLYWFRASVYRSVRNQMAIVTFAALAVHLAFPLAPPRLMPGFVDTMRRFGPSIYPADLLEGAANQIAAMPSLHFGWAVIATVAVIRHGHGRIRHIVIIHPIIMTLTILATANHWWLDAVAALAIIAATEVLQRRRQWADAVLGTITRRRPPSSARC